MELYPAVDSKATARFLVDGRYYDHAPLSETDTTAYSRMEEALAAIASDADPDEF